MKELNQWGKNIYQSNGENNYEEERKKLTLHTWNCEMSAIMTSTFDDSVLFKFKKNTLCTKITW